MRAPGRWELSPAYDVNPVPEIDRALTPETPVSEQLDENGIAAALSAAPRFGLNPGDARTILREVFTAVSGWRQAGKALRLKASTLDAYETAFVNPHMKDASRV